MTIETVFLLIALWILFGVINAWVLHARGHSGWRWTTVCVLSGPLTVSVLYDQIRVEPADEPTGSAEQQTAGYAEPGDDAEPAADAVGEWPRDDPEGPLVMQGYRGLADH